MNGRQWKPGGGAVGSGSAANAFGPAPGKQTLVQTLDAEDPRHKAASAPLQTKLAIGSPGDSHEQEADRVADHVMSGGAVSQPIGPI